MKICNFRPLVCLALIVMLEIWVSAISLWLTCLLAIALGVCFIFARVPRHFQIVTLVVYCLVAISFIVHTCCGTQAFNQNLDPDVGLRGVVLRYANWYLHQFLSDTNAELVFAMLFGNKTGVPWLVRVDFSVTGVAHLLAVSGLHVGLLTLAIEYILRWCRVPKRYRVWVLLPVLIFYTYLCRWQYAILRAVLMCLVYAFARNNLRVADRLSTLALAAVVILTLFPYALWSLSFQLSFAAVLGIVLWYDSLLKLCPVKPLAMYLAVTSTTLPLLIICFDGVSLYGLLANVLIMPLLVLVFYVSMMAVITVIFGAVLWLVDPVLTFARTVLTALSNLPLAMLPVSGPPVIAILYLVAILLCSRFIFLPKKIKYPLAVALFACYFVLLVV